MKRDSICEIAACGFSTIRYVLRKTASGLGLTPYEQSGEGGDDAFESDDQAIALDVDGICRACGCEMGMHELECPEQTRFLAVRPC